jgi:hypothetical protein
MSTTVPLTTVYANTRNGTATYVQSDGTIATQSALLTRTDHWISGQRGRLFEPARTNSIRNSTMAGATAGTLSTTGSLPTNWSMSGIATSSVTVATGTENGLAYTELRINGTPTASIRIFLDTTTGIAASAGQNWTFSTWLKLESGTLTNIDDFQVANTRLTSGGAFHSTGELFTTLTSTFQRFSFPDTSIDDADGTGTIAYIRPRLQFTWTSGAVDFTIRIYGPQMEQGAFATTFIPTSTVAVPRLADRASVALSDIGFDAAGGSILFEGRAYYNTSGSVFPRVFQIDDGTLNNRLTMSISEATGVMSYGLAIGGVNQGSVTRPYTSGDYFKAGLRYEGDNCVLSLGGSNSVTDTSVTLPSGLTTVNWQTNQSGANNEAAVFITKFATYAKEFSDATLNAETA